MEHGFQKFPIAHLAGGSRSRMFCGGHGGFELLPHLGGDDFTHGMFEHPEFQSLSRYFVHTIIREQNLALDDEDLKPIRDSLAD